MLNSISQTPATVVIYCGNPVASANIAKAVCVEGADVPDPLAFDPELADARILPPEGGKVRIEAAPSEEADAAFFFRVGVRQD